MPCKPAAATIGSLVSSLNDHAQLTTPARRVVAREVPRYTLSAERPRAANRTAAATAAAAARHGAALHRCRCGRGEPSPGADVAGATISWIAPPRQNAEAPDRMWHPSHGVDVAGASPVTLQMWQGVSPLSRRHAADSSAPRIA